MFFVHTTIPNKWNAFVSSGAEVLIGRLWVHIKESELSGKEDCNIGMSEYEARTHPCKAVRDAFEKYDSVYAGNIRWALITSRSQLGQLRILLPIINIAEERLKSDKISEFERSGIEDALALFHKETDSWSRI